MRFLRFLPVWVLATASALCADVTGTWSGQIATRNGIMQDVSFKFVQKGNTLTGKLYSDSGSNPIVEGIVVGDHINFTVVIQEQQGNLFNETKLLFDGCVDGTDIQLTRERSAVLNPETGGPNKPNPRQNIGLKRLF